MAERALLVGSLTSAPGVERIGEEVDILEVRGDLIGDPDPESLRHEFEGRLLYTLRSSEEGGQGPDGGNEREQRLVAVADRFDLIDLEGERDLGPGVLAHIPPEKRIISWHGPAAGLSALRLQFERLSREPAAFYKLVTEVDRPKQGLAPLALLRTLGRSDVIAFASGASGTWTRLLAPRLGAAVVFGSIGRRPAAPGQLSMEQLRIDYGLPELRSVEVLYGVVGNPVSHSLSPRLHNRMYRELGLEYLYVPFEVPVFGDFWLDVVESGSLKELGFPLVGLSVTAPFKEIALAVAGAASPLADHIGSANTLVRRGGVWEAESTDPQGIRGPLVSRGVEIAGKPAAVIGSGGAGRSAAFGLAVEQAEVTLVNRGVERGRRVARELGVAFSPLAEFDPGAFELIVNATPLGSGPEGELPFAPTALRGECVVVDLAYLPNGPTPLVIAAREQKKLAIDGREALLYQALQQFQLMTGAEMSPRLARETLELEGE
jgi:3-dehydroquinate dehydratase/shikimate dehydrogenase